MKLLLVILSVIVAINGNPINLTEADYLKIGQELLEHVKATKVGINNIEEAIKSIVSEKLKQIPAVQKVLDQFNEQKNINIDCAAEILHQYFKVLESTTEEVQKKTSNHLTKNEDYFKNTKEELDFVEKILEGYMELETAACAKEVDDCMLVGKGADHFEQLFKSIDEFKQKVLEHVEIEIASKDLQDKIEKNLANVPKCLVQH